MSSITKGQWIFNELDFKVRGSGDIEGRTVIANLSPKMDYSRGKNTQYSNGKLIASAPTLLLACQNALKDIRAINIQLHSEGKHGYRLMEKELSEAIKLSGVF